MNKRVKKKAEGIYVNKIKRHLFIFAEKSIPGVAKKTPRAWVE